MAEEVYIGTKVIAAEPMTDLEFASKIRPISAGVEIFTDGKGAPGYKVRYEDGYVSWSPKDVFEQCYRKVTVAETLLVITRTDVIPPKKEA